MTMPAVTRSLLTRAYLRRLALSKAPIVLGPFRSELGFEVLYWIPFLTWALKRYGISPDRCLVLSRGGMGRLYGAMPAIDLYELRTVEQVRLENGVDAERRKILKQTNVTDWDRAVVRDAVTRQWGKDTKAHLLHPSWMYWLFDPVWQERASIQHVATHCEWAPLPVPALPEGVTLPKEFVAVRFYERFTLPFHDPIRGLVAEMIGALAQRMPVVLLYSGLFLDDHTDLPVKGPNILSLPVVAPAQNLLLQAAVLARAQAFVGTYGGVAQWALRYAKPSLSFYAQFSGTAFAHRNLSEQLAARLQVPFECCDLRAVNLYRAALAPMVADRPEVAVPSTVVMSGREVMHAVV